MNIFKSNAPLRAFYLFFASVIWLGIWLTGFSVVSWVLYIPAAALLLGAATGFCPSLIFFSNTMKQPLNA